MVHHSTKLVKGYLPGYYSTNRNEDEKLGL